MIENFETCLKKQSDVKQLFASCATVQEKYEKIIELGRQLPVYPLEFKTQEAIVKGCQSIMYLHAELKEGKIQFQAYSEALISAGLAALLIKVYHDEPPETVLTCPPRFLDELGIMNSLSPSRSNGLASLFQRMKQEALKFILLKEKS